MIAAENKPSEKYHPYPEYKDSGVEWLGTIPTHWEMWKLAHAYEVIGSGTTPPTNEEGWFGDGIPWVTTGELREIIIEQTSKCITYEALNAFSALRVHPAGSVVIAMYGATIGRLGILGVNATTNQACCVLTRSIHLDNKYVFYWLQAFRDDIVRLSSGGGQPNINQEKVASLKISAPDERHQRTISAFLDYETARIDRLIAKQQRLIELLKEKRQTVISHAVTKGLNSDVPLKESGIEWLGQVPEHWIHNFKLGAVAEQNRGSFVNGPFGSDLLSNELTQEGVPVIYIRDVKPSGYYRKSTDCVTPQKAKQLNVCMVEPGDVLVAKVGSPPGDACIYPNSEPEAIITQDVVRIRVNKQLCDAYYLSCLLNSTYGKAIVDDISVESTRKRFGLGDYKQLKIPLPPLDEQIQLASWIRDQCDKLDMLNTKAKCTIDLMQERRTALISAAVTGKIDLRGWTPPTDNEVTA